MMVRPIEVVLLDAVVRRRQYLRQALQLHPRIALRHSGPPEGAPARPQIGGLQPGGVVVLDLGAPTQLIEEVLALPDRRVIVVTDHIDDPRLVWSLERGAVDYGRIDGGATTAALERLIRELVNKVVLAGRLDEARLAERVAELRRSLVPRSGHRVGRGRSHEHQATREVGLDRTAAQRARVVGRSRPRVVVIGASTGGPRALGALLEALAGPLPVPLIAALHMPAGFTSSFADRLSRTSNMAVVEAAAGLAIGDGDVWIAPGGVHTIIEADARGREVFAIEEASPQDRYCPSVDRLFASAAERFGPAVLAVVLTGMGVDGREGARAVREAGGQVIAEAESSALVHGMPAAAIGSGAVDQVLTLGDIVLVLDELNPGRRRR